MKGVVYRGIRLMPGSESYRLYEEKKMKELDKHLKELDRKWAEYLEAH